MTYWTFNEGTFTDSSGNGCTASLAHTSGGSNPTIINDGKVGKTFYGSSTGKCLINVSAANVNLNNFSISFWGKQPSANWMDYLSVFTSQYLDSDFQRANNSLSIYNSPWGTFAGSTNVSSGFHHFAFTSDPVSGDGKLYIDGGLKATVNKADISDIISYITLGGNFNTGQRNGTATVDEVQFYNQPLTAEQVSFLYNNPSLYLATGYQRDVTADGNWSDSVWNANQLTDQAFANSSAVQLDAENSPTLTLDKNVTVNSLDFNGSMTIDGSNTITLNGEKRITVAGADDVVTISTPISPLYDNTFTKTGAGTLVFTEANAYSGNPTVSDGTLRLTDDAVTANGVITLEADETLGTKGTLEYNVASGEKTLIFTNAASVIGNGDILKTGEGRLKINTEGISNADLEFSVDNFVVSSGRVDIRGYMNGNLLVDAIDGPNAVFSPGNSVGEATFGGGFILNEAGSALLMEIGGEETNKNDSLIVTGDIELNNGLIYLELADDSTLKGGDTFTAILYGSNSGEDGFRENLLSHVSSYYFTDLDYVPLGGGVYAITGTVDANAVPEPSTWALLILGAAGLLYVRKRNK